MDRKKKSNSKSGKKWREISRWFFSVFAQNPQKTKINDCRTPLFWKNPKMSISGISRKLRRPARNFPVGLSTIFITIFINFYNFIIDCSGKSLVYKSCIYLIEFRRELCREFHERGVSVSFRISEKIAFFEILRRNFSHRFRAVYENTKMSENSEHFPWGSFPDFEILRRKFSPQNVITTITTIYSCVIVCSKSHFL
jgi:hypothetical protein